MHQFQGYVCPGLEDLVCKLEKAMYGLKQAPQAWFRKINIYPKNQGLKKLNSDGNLYYFKNKGKVVFLVLYVDNLLIIGVDTSRISQFKT